MENIIFNGVKFYDSKQNLASGVLEAKFYDRKSRMDFVINLYRVKALKQDSYLYDVMNHKIIKNLINVNVYKFNHNHQEIESIAQNITTHLIWNKWAFDKIVNEDGSIDIDRVIKTLCAFLHKVLLREIKNWMQKETNTRQYIKPTKNNNGICEVTYFNKMTDSDGKLIYEEPIANVNVEEEVISNINYKEVIKSADLTEEEIQILEYHLDGHPVREIADFMVCGKSTVQRKLVNILERLKKVVVK